MQVSVEATKGLEYKMKVKVPSSEVERKIDARLQVLAKTAKIDGFRPGKIPLSVIKQRFGAGVRQEIIGDVIRDSLFAALEKEKLSPAGMPAVEPAEIQEGKDFEYVATFEVFPEFEVKDLKNEEVEQITSTLTPADIDTMFEKLRKQHTDWEEVGSHAQSEHKVNIDFEGFINGEKFPGGSAAGYDLILGAGSMIPGFEDNILGAKSGDTVTANISFPEDYPHKDVAGKPVKFDIKLNKIYAPKMPELNDEFAHKFDIKEGGLKKLREEIETSMERELEIRLKEKNKKAIFDKIVEKNPVDLPKALIDNEIKQMQNDMYQRISGGKKIDRSKLPELPRELFEAQAKKRVHLGLVINQYIKQNELKPDQAKIQQMLEKLSGAYENPQEWITWYKSSKQRMANLEAAALEDQVVEKLTENAKVHKQEMDYFTIAASEGHEHDDDDHDHIHGPDCDHDHDDDFDLDHVHGPDCHHDHE